MRSWRSSSYWRIVTVTGAVKIPGNFLVPVGTSAKELIQLCGGVTVPKTA